MNLSGNLLPKTKLLYNHQFPKRVRMLPIWILMIWLLSTVAVFFYGPYEYQIPNRLQLYGYLFAVHIALYLGYCRGIRVQGRIYHGPWSGINIAKVCIAITTIFVIVQLIITSGGDVGRLSLALQDPATAYRLGSTKGNITIFNYISIILSPIKVLGITIGIFYWNSLKKVQRAFLIFIVLITFLENIGASVRAGIVFMTFILMASIGAGYFSGQLQFNWRSKLVIVIILMVFIIGFFKYVNFLTEKRQPGTNVLLNPITMEQPLEHNIINSFFPETWHKTATVVAFYVSHGYARLAQAMDMEFTGIGFGVGNSPFLMRNVERLTGLANLKKLSYGMRLDPEAELDRIGSFWSTYYVWIASDVTFPGSIVVIFLIGYLLALAWIDALRWRNPIAVSAFSCLASLVFSFPRTNPMQDGAGLTVYFGLPLLWWMTRKFKITIKHKSISRRSE